MSKNTVLKFKKEELDALLNDENSQVHLQEDVKHHMMLPPVCLSDPHGAILAILNSDLMKFFPKFKGILLSYKRVRMLGSTGNIYDDNCHIHVNLLVDFYIFTPTVGCIMRGIVSKKSPYNIGLLVHKGFNVAIPIPKSEADATWENNSVQIGQEIKFEVEILNFKGNIPYIRGKLIAEDISTNHKKKKKKKSTNSELEQPVADSEDYVVVPSRKRKRKHSEEPEYQTINPALTKEISSDSGVSSPSRKRKKYDNIEDTDNLKNSKHIGQDAEVTSFHIIDSVSHKEKKKKKKKSKDNGDNEEASIAHSHVTDASYLDEMQVSSEQLEPSRTSETFEGTLLPKKKKKKKHARDKEDQMQQSFSPEGVVQNCTTSINNELSVDDRGDNGSLTANCSMKEKKRKKHHKSELETG